MAAPNISVTLGNNITELTLITPIEAGRTQLLEQTLAGIQDAIKNGDVSPIQRISTIHYARWVIIDDGTRLLFTSNFDGSWLVYLQDFAEKIPGGLDSIWGHCVGWPGCNPFEPFVEWVHKHQVHTNCFYAAYPSATVKDVLLSLYWKSKTEAYLAALGTPPPTP